MKRVFGRITAAILITTALAACSSEPDAGSEAGTVRVLAPMNSSQGSYSLNILDLQGIEDLQTMSGKFVRYFMSPRIVQNRLDGAPPKARFIRNKNGEHIPANELTQQLVAVYAHMQKLASLDEELGAGGVNTWPRDIGVAVRVKGGIRNNAFYDGATDSMLFVPYTQQGLPIAINGGILAHEHFHSLFYKMVLPNSPFKGNVHNRDEFLKIVDEEDVAKDLNSRQRQDILPIDISESGIDEGSLHFYYHLAITRGLNEGLADFWGWMYTGDPDFIAQSLPSEKSNRSLKVSDETAVNSLPSSESVQRAIKVFHNMNDGKKMKEHAVSYAYTLATQYSRFLKRFTDIYSRGHALDPITARKDIARVIVATLPKIKMGLEAAKGETYFSSQNFLKMFIEQFGEMNERECQYLAQVFTNSQESGVKFICKEESGWHIVAEKEETPQGEVQ